MTNDTVIGMKSWGYDSVQHAILNHKNQKQKDDRYKATVQ